MPANDVPSPLAFPWYEQVPNTAGLQQGDLLDNFPVVVPAIAVADAPIEGGTEIELTGRVEHFNVVVMTQSCDFAKLSDNDQVVLCPRLDYFAVAPQRKSTKGPEGWKSLINGRIIGVHLINKCDIQGHAFNYQIVDLRQIFSVPLALVKRVVSNTIDRIRLCPPYREHLAQAFAQQFMRIGLPIDLPREMPSPPPQA